MLARPDLLTDDRFSTNLARVTNRSTLIPLLNQELSSHTTDEWLKKMRGGGFPHAPVNNIEQTFAHPQAVARGVVCEVEHPRAGKLKLVSPAVSYNNQRMEVSTLDARVSDGKVDSRSFAGLSAPASARRAHGGSAPGARLRRH